MQQSLISMKCVICLSATYIKLFSTDHFSRFGATCFEHDHTSNVSSNEWSLGHQLEPLPERLRFFVLLLNKWCEKRNL